MVNPTNSSISKWSIDDKNVSAYTLIFALFLLFLSPKVLAQVPCWLNDLSINGNKNMVGIASKISASHLPPLHFAKAKALNNWALSEGIAPVNFKENLKDLTEYVINDQTVYFADQYEDKSSIYVLVSKHKTTNDSSYQCEISTCQIQTCSPSWLCSNNSENISVIGISSFTGIKNDQIKNVITNAQDISRTINKAHVRGVIDTLHSSSSIINISNIQERYSITNMSNEQSKVNIGQMCTFNGILFSQVSFNIKSISQSHNWMVQPLLGDTLGVVGHAKGLTSTGRLSDLLQVAIKRALFEMAKTKNIKVENDLKLTINNDGYYSLMSKSHQYTESIVSAYIADMKMKINEKLQPEIFIWLLENKDKS